MANQVQKQTHEKNKMNQFFLHRLLMLKKLIFIFVLGVLFSQGSGASEVGTQNDSHSADRKHTESQNFSSNQKHTESQNFSSNQKHTESQNLREIKSDYPKVTDQKGHVEVVMTELPQVGHLSARKKSQLAGSVKIVTLENSWVEIQIESHRKIFVLSDSEIIIPEIQEGTGRVRELQIKKGQVRFIQDQQELDPISLSSSLFLLDWKMGDFVLTVKTNEARVEVYNLSQRDFVFSALNAEDKAQLKQNQKVVFQGRISEGEIQYDILLRGRKIPQGVLESPQSLTAEEVKAWDLTELEKKRAQEKAIELKKLQEKNKRKPGEICDEPRGRLNQCVWRCQAWSQAVSSSKKSLNSSLPQGCQKCVRQRCLADGSWGDSFDLPRAESIQNCNEKKPQAMACDY